MISGERLAPQQRDLEGTGPVIVHGDFGPQNMLFDDEVGVVVAILDWESAPWLAVEDRPGPNG